MARALLLGVLLALMAATAQAQTLADLLVMGADLQYRGESQQAEAVFAQALELDPDSVFAQDQHALAVVKQGDYARGLELFSRVARAHPDDVFAGLWRGVLLLWDNRPQDAVAAFQAVLETDPENADAHYFLGVVEWTDHRSLEAAAHFLEAQRLGSRDPSTHYRLALAFRGLDMEANALLELYRALELDPAHVDALNMLGWLLHARGDVDGAKDAWNRVLAAHPGNAEAKANLARVCNEQALAAWNNGRVETARELWRETLSADPGNGAAMNFLHTSAGVEP